MTSSPKQPFTVGGPGFDPEQLFDNSALFEKIHGYLRSNDLHSAVQAAFSIPSTDKYVYHANASVTLPQVQTAVHAGPTHGLHDWYLDAQNHPIEHPSTADVAVYVALFDPSKSASNLLKGMKSNAKKGSLRAGIADHLIAKRYLDPSIVVPKRKAQHHNPYVDFWAWSCHSLEYAGPDANTVNVKMSHHVLPIFMHHFGCSCPSYESLEILNKIANGKTILDVGSGNGYWTLMLRKQGCQVIAVDSMQSQWRTCWIGDTVVTDGIQFVKNRDGAGKNDMLLMVYPIVGEDFTRSVLQTYQGDIISVVGTQNGNGYTVFRDETFDQWMQRERKDFEKIVQVPLPSFAGKDDALFVFKRKI